MDSTLFINKLKESGIKVYNVGMAEPDFEIEETEVFYKFLIEQKITYVFAYTCPFLGEEIGIEEVKEIFNSEVSKSWKCSAIKELKYIDNAFFISLYKEFRAAFDEEIYEFNNSIKKLQELQKEDAIGVIIYAMLDGKTIEHFICNHVNHAIPDKEELTDKMKNYLSKVFSEKYIEIKKMNQEKEDEYKNSVIAEITAYVSDSKILSMNKTERTSFADTTWDNYSNEKGHEWVTQKKVRAIVEAAYIRLKDSQ